jgi:uncharacterized protein
MINRRSFLKWLGRLTAGGFLTGTYAFAIEPGFRLNTTVYAFTPPRWTPGLKLRVVMLADPHCAEPYMSLSRWKRIIAAANALKPDMHLLLGDYVAGNYWRTATVPVAQIADAATALTSPIGTFGICGNHDWWDDRSAQRLKQGPCIAEKTFVAAGIPMLENKAVRLEKDGKPFWISGTSSLVAMRTRFRGRYLSLARIDDALAQITDDAPVIHMAHEPDLFTDIPDRVSLTVSGHTHGGQVRLLGYSPMVPSSYGNRFSYGHVVENGRHLVVSGGLGCSIIPVRFGMPPEIVVLELG